MNHDESQRHGDYGHVCEESCEVWETPCPNRTDCKHCEHWYDNEGPCCACGDDSP